MSRSGACPSCGGNLTFEVGSSRAAVCRYCKTLVVRKGQDFAALGKVADVVPTGSKIALDATGRYFGERFRVVGRMQIEWEQGVWDEWYVSFPDERWGWLAEAQGRYIVSFQLRGAEIPAFDDLAPGEPVELGRHGRFVVSDIKYARIVTASGELPDEIEIDRASRTVDLEGQEGAFATIDYGADDAEPGEPVVFVGRQIPLADLGIEGVPASEIAASSRDDDAIVCGNCGKPVSMIVPGQSVRLVCNACNALIEPAQGAARVIQVLQRHREEPPIAIGKTGKLRGKDVVVAGWVRRSCVVSLVTYPWEELVLYEPRSTSFSWLVIADGHWSLARSISSGEVTVWGGDAEYRDKKYKLFSSVVGVVEQVLGEFPWRVTSGEAAEIEEYIAPPEGLSLERNGNEVSWSHIDHLDAAEVAKAFDVPELASQRPIGVGPFQPWPYAAPLRAIIPWMIGGVVVSFFLFLFFAMRGETSVLKHSFSTEDVPFVDPAPQAINLPSPPTRLRTYVSEPITLSGYRSIEVKVESNVDNAWAFVSGALIHEETGVASFFAMETSYYHGIDFGTVWKEGEVDKSQLLPSPSKGSYIVRADLEWDPLSRQEPFVTLEIREAGYSGRQFFAVLALLLSPLLLLLHRRSFETSRKEQSNLLG